MIKSKAGETPIFAYEGFNVMGITFLPKISRETDQKIYIKHFSEHGTMISERREAKQVSLLLATDCYLEVCPGDSSEKKASVEPSDFTG